MYETDIINIKNDLLSSFVVSTRSGLMKGCCIDKGINRQQYSLMIFRSGCIRETV